MTASFRAFAACLALFTVAACGQAPSSSAAPAAGQASGQASGQSSGGAAAASSSSLSPLPASVAAALASLAGQCSEVGGTPRTENAVRRADLNGDNREDFVLFAGWIDCENAVSIYGDRVKSLSVFPGDGQGGAGDAFGDWVFDAELEDASGSTQLWLTTMGEQCGRPPAANFASESFCNRAITWNGATQRFEYAPVSTVRMIE